MSRNNHCRTRSASGCKCTHDSRFKLLTLNKIMALESADDITFSLKVFASAFEVATEVLSGDQNDPDLRSDVISICENNIRHGHKLFVARENSQDVL